MWQEDLLFVCGCVHMCAHSCEGWELMLGITLDTFLFYWDKIFQSNQKPTHAASLLSHLAVGIYCFYFQRLKWQLDHHAHPAFPWVSWNPNPDPHTCFVSTLRLCHSPAHGQVLLTLGTVNCPHRTLGSQTLSDLIFAHSTLLVPLYFVTIIYMFQDP